MNSIVRALCGLAFGFGALIASRDAAAYCGTWQMGSGNRELVFGEELVNGSPTGILAICEQNAGTGSPVFSNFSSCTTGLSDQFRVYGGSGDNWIGPLQSGTGDITCTSSGGTTYGVRPFDASWSIGLWATGGDGFDRIHGTGYADELFSYTETSSGTASDGDNDRLCGWGGDDALTGDQSNTSGGPEECMDGGNGYDVCDDGDGSNVGDRCVSGTGGCDTFTTGGWRDTSISASICGCTTAGAEFWSL